MDTHYLYYEMRKTSISQRWEKKTVRRAKKFAKKAGCSVTQFTIDAIELLGQILDYHGIKKLNNEDRIKLIKNALENSPDPIVIKPPTKTKIPIKKQIIDFLISNPNKSFSTLELAKILDKNKATIRTYIRDIYENDKTNFVIELGRPNKIMYIDKSKNMDNNT